MQPVHKQTTNPDNNTNIKTAYALWFLGLHRFYLNRYFTGLIQLMTMALMITAIVAPQSNPTLTKIISIIWVLWWLFDASLTHKLFSQQRSVAKPKQYLHEINQIWASWDGTQKTVQNFINRLLAYTNNDSLSFDERCKLTAKTLYYLGRGYIASDQNDEAIKCFKAALTLNLSQTDLDNINKASLLPLTQLNEINAVSSWLENCYEQSRQLDSTEKLLLDRVDRARGLAIGHPTETAKALCALAEFYHKHDQSDNAIKWSNQALSQYAVIPTNDDSYKLVLSIKVTMILIAHKRTADAELQLKRVLTDVGGGETFQLGREMAICHNLLADINQQYTQWKLAEVDYLSAIKLLKSADKPDDELLLTILIKVANLYSRQQRYEDCVGVCDQMIILSERIYDTADQKCIHSHSWKKQAQSLLDQQLVATTEWKRRTEQIEQEEAALDAAAQARYPFTSGKLNEAYKQALLANGTSNSESPIHLEMLAGKDKHTFDKAKYWLDLLPEHVPSGQMYVVGGMILGWLADHDLCDCSNIYVAKAVERFKTGQSNLLEIYSEFAEVITGDQLTEEGYFFMLSYYESCYENDFYETLQGHLDSAFEVEASLENYARITQVIDNSFREWKREL